MGFGDIDAMPCGARVSGDAACGDDGRGAIRQQNHGMLDGHWQGELDEWIQQGGDRVGVGDGTRGWFCAFCFHADCAVRADGMGGDTVGVGDIGAVQGGAWVSGDETYCVVSWRTIWEHERGMVGGRWICQRDASGKQCRDGIGIIHSARVEPWACGIHGDGAGRADGMRGDSMGVGDVGAVQSGTRCSRDTACGDDGRGAIRQRDRIILDRHWQGEHDEGIQ